MRRYKILIILESKNFGIEIKKLLLDVGMQQAELAERVGVSTGFLSQVLSGKKEAFETRRKILSVVNEEVKKLLTPN